MSDPFAELVGRVVLAEWLDSHHIAGWTLDAPATEPLVCLSAGRLTHVGEEAVTIAGHWSAEPCPQRNGEMTIPRRALVSLRALQ